MKNTGIMMNEDNLSDDPMHNSMDYENDDYNQY